MPEYVLLASSPSLLPAAWALTKPGFKVSVIQQVSGVNEATDPLKILDQQPKLYSEICHLNMRPVHQVEERELFSLT